MNALERVQDIINTLDEANSEREDNPVIRVLLRKARYALEDLVRQSVHPAEDLAPTVVDLRAQLAEYAGPDVLTTLERLKAGQGLKVEAIKLIRRRLGSEAIGLKEAKDLVEKFFP